jgi:hypothetical protein
MSMLTLSGIVANIYKSPPGVNKTTGEAFGNQDRIQIMCENILQNGQKRVELIDLTIGDVTPYQGCLNKPVSVSVGVYVNAGKPAFFALKTQKAPA